MGGPGKSASSPATLYFPCGNLSKPLGAMALNVLTLNEAPACIEREIERKEREREKETRDVSIESDDKANKNNDNNDDRQRPKRRRRRPDLKDIIERVRARKSVPLSLAFKKVLHQSKKVPKKHVPAYPPDDDPDDEALLSLAALLSFSFLFLASSSIFSSISISSLEDDDARMVPLDEPTLLRWNCALLFKTFFCDKKADDLAEEAAVKDANIVRFLFCFD